MGILADLIIRSGGEKPVTRGDCVWVLGIGYLLRFLSDRRTSGTAGAADAVSAPAQIAGDAARILRSRN